MVKSNAPHLGDFPLSTQKFTTLSEALSEFHSAAFLKLRSQQRQSRISQVLCTLIQKASTPCFLLPAIIDYIEQIHKLQLIDSYTFVNFELWLNQFSNLSAEENYAIRAKIVGKAVPRSAYQGIFPIGMGKVYPGSHFVTAHSSPDLDTTIASFWGWIDALGARVSEGLHVWNVPGGAPQEQIEVGLLFSQLLGEHVFEAVTKTRTALSLSGMDLMTQKGFVKEHAEASILEIDHAGMEKAIVLVDGNGAYLGDWRSLDVEGVRQVISLFNHSLRWFAHTVQMELLSLFSKEKLIQKDITLFLERILHCTLASSGPAREFTESQAKTVDDYLIKVLHLKKGLGSTFQEFAQQMKTLSVTDFQHFLDLLQSIQKGFVSLLDNRPQLFDYLQQVMKSLDQAIEKIRAAVERLGIAMKIKTDVFGQRSDSISYRSDVDEIAAKMAQTSYLSVTSTDKEGYAVPLGVVHARDLAKPILGTVTLRDFCNKEEIKIPSYLEIISVIDHHKSQLQTNSAAMVTISDAQSSNVMCAEMAFAINDRFGTAGMAREKIDAQVDELKKASPSSESRRCLARLLQKQCVLEESSNGFIDPTREAIEYLHFLYGILDDTDLLAKVSARDLDCVVQLLNRLKTLFLQKEVEVVSLQDIPRDEQFLRKAAVRLLQHPDLYSLYKKVYLAKEKAVEKNIAQGARGDNASFFVDTKVQNGCARVGQSKLFPSNYPLFTKETSALQKQWQSSAHTFFFTQKEVDLHMQMISTVAGAEEVFKDTNAAYTHQDELWIWIPFTEASVEHLKEFLNAFSSLFPGGKKGLDAAFYGEKAQDYASVFAESFPSLSSQVVYKDKSPSLAVLKYTAGMINSRKAQISPYLPNTKYQK